MDVSHVLLISATIVMMVSRQEWQFLQQVDQSKAVESHFSTGRLAREGEQHVSVFFFV